jgi:hypothetical protein
VPHERKLIEHATFQHELRVHGLRNAAPLSNLKHDRIGGDFFSLFGVVVILEELPSPASV